FYFKPPFRLPQEQEERYVTAMLQMAVGDDVYPGDMTTSENWPGVAPGTKGMNNAIAPRYLNLSGFSSVQPQPKVLWIRGADDQIVSDTSFFDFGYLGSLGAIPGWPGNETYPAQPMITQVRATMDQYRGAGGDYTELVYEECGHSPHLEHADRFTEDVRSFLEG
ncbi:MAG: alpha/beta hydrolase, partial [Acidimicrobiia bacterium]